MARIVATALNGNRKKPLEQKSIKYTWITQADADFLGPLIQNRAAQEWVLVLFSHRGVAKRLVLFLSCKSRCANEPHPGPSARATINGAAAHLPGVTHPCQVELTTADSVIIIASLVCLTH